MIPLAVAIGLASVSPLTAQTPTNTLVANGLALPVGWVCHGNDLMFVYERGGRVRVRQGSTMLAAPLIDLQQEVGGWRDFGLLGFALDPAFAANGHYYLCYAVDRHHLLHYGTPGYNPTQDEYYAASIVRVARYTADSTTGFTTTVPGSRLVLFGETATTGAPLTFEGHGSGQLAFGSDGTLLVGIGDGAGFGVVPDGGSHAATYYLQALADGILRPDENVGAFRAQMITSCSGKILRLDPATGDGVPSNPFYDANAPRSPRSRVWALGLRNPFRLSVRPGTGASDPAFGNPGTIYVGDVGWATREELNVVRHGGQNFGWPIYEGIEPQPGFAPLLVANPDAPNPLAGGSCQPRFRFHDLLQQATPNPAPFFPNPCNPAVGIAASTPTFVHTPPVLDWHHNNLDARVPVFESGVLVARQLGTPAAGVPGTQFRGSCVVGGCWHSGLTFPGPFGPSYYLADFLEGWIRRLEFDANDELVAVHEFATAPLVMMLGEHPGDHSLVYVSLSEQLRRLSFGLEPPPVAIASADAAFGSGSFDVQLDARASYDPQGQPLTWFWNLGNGRTSTSPQLGATFHATGTPFLHQVQLTVTDTAGASTTQSLPIGFANTPPQVAITSFANGSRYSSTGPTTVPLAANVSDAEHGPAQLTYAWQVFRHHEQQVYADPADPLPVTSVALAPAPAGNHFHACRVDLTVTDAGGLATLARHWLFPDSSGASSAVWMTSPAGGDRFEPGVPVVFRALTTGTVLAVEYYVDGTQVGVATAPPYEVAWTPTASGPATAVAMAIADDGTSSYSDGVALQFVAPIVTRVRGKGPWADAIEATAAASVPIANATSLVLGDDGTAWRTGLHFMVPALPIGARVRTATVAFRAAQTDSAAASLLLTCDRNPYAPPIAATPGNLRQRKTLPGAVSWQPDAWLAGASGAAQRTPDLGPLVQTLVLDPRWNGSLLLLLKGSGVRRAVTWNGDPMTGPALTIEWLPPVADSLPLPADADGSETLGSGNVDLAAPSLPLGEDVGFARATAFAFALPLVDDGRLESARLQFTAAGGDVGPAALTISAHDADDAAALMANANDISARSRLTETVTWHPPEWTTPGEAGAAQRSPDLAPLLRCILQRPGWQKGGRVVLIVEGWGRRTALATESGSAVAPQLELRLQP
ncbi:MAG: PQQ-dependent sugar dehydrogenase [Planctomycetes bacterium]|nr:PQQ-dependent sugar dehydrogenase [Planctomycetota bacterium]